MSPLHAKPRASRTGQDQAAGTPLVRLGRGRAVLSVPLAQHLGAPQGCLKPLAPLPTLNIF